MYITRTAQVDEMRNACEAFGDYLIGYKPDEIFEVSDPKTGEVICYCKGGKIQKMTNEFAAAYVSYCSECSL